MDADDVDVVEFLQCAAFVEETVEPPLENGLVFGRRGGDPMADVAR